MIASRRKNKPFKAINCAAIPEQLLESELFGSRERCLHRRPKVTNKDFLNRQTAGTVFLDEIGECNLGLQAKLLTVLQPLIDQGPSFRQFRQVGAE